MGSEGWRTATAAELQSEGVLLVEDGNHGENRPRSHEIGPDGRPHIRAADLVDGRVDFEGAQRISDEASSRIKKGQGRPYDVLVSHKGTVGRVAMAPPNCEPFVCSPQTTLWRTLDPSKLDARYLYAQARSPLLQAQFQRVMHESDMAPYVSLTTQRTFRICVPPIATQRAIADILSALDDKIESNRRLAEGRDDLLATWFCSLGRSAGRRQPLSDLAVEIRTRLQPADQPQATFEQFSIPAFDAGRGPDVCTGADMASAKTLLPETPAVLVSKLNPRTKRVWWPERLSVGIPVCSPEFVALLPHDQGEAAWLFGCVAFDQAFYDQVLAAVTGTTGSRQRVKPRDVMSATIPIVDSERRGAWVVAARAALQQRVTLLRESRTLTAIRDALLPKLVSGQIQVPLADNPEEMVGAAIEALA